MTIVMILVAGLQNQDEHPHSDLSDAGYEEAREITIIIMEICIAH